MTCRPTWASRRPPTSTPSPLEATAPEACMAEGQPSPGTLLPLALVQLQPGADPATNRRAAEAWLERALQPPAGTPNPKLLMLPEIWNAPMRLPASLAMVARLAMRHGVSVIAGSIPESGSDGRLHNTATVIDPDGRLLAKHRKVHLFDVDVPGGIRFRESDSLTGGNRLTVLDGAGDPLATGLAQPPNLGLLICYNICFGAGPTDAAAAGRRRDRLPRRLQHHHRRWPWPARQSPPASSAAPIFTGSRPVGAASERLNRPALWGIWPGVRTGEFQVRLVPPGCTPRGLGYQFQRLPAAVS
ncbi:nitrilase-related carbon-nitrogen hydrolase [Cyanobium sp. BA20m-p-22]|uniref:nitrilase-related carbon-nitrogen hydrolase n=1 Tax=Cyanobium sp. BA20m-p-22 TaxID=2823704 RepID=UPI0020CFA903|nr:nitrilase-related carbon-nitrogen hydrolase [Cyanobium sp. BA20m-p-22]